jgi:hypothetical protein
MNSVIVACSVFTFGCDSWSAMFEMFNQQNVHFQQQIVVNLSLFFILYIVVLTCNVISYSLLLEMSSSTLCYSFDPMISETFF